MALGFKATIIPATGSAIVLADAPWPITASDITWQGNREIERTQICQADYQAIFDRNNRSREFSFNTVRVFASMGAMAQWYWNHDDEVPAIGRFELVLNGMTAVFENVGIPNVTINRIYGVSVFCRYTLMLGKRLA